MFKEESNGQAAANYILKLIYKRYTNRTRILIIICVIPGYNISVYIIHKYMFIIIIRVIKYLGNI